MTEINFKTQLDKEQFDKWTDFLVWLKNDREFKNGTSAVNKNAVLPHVSGSLPSEDEINHIMYRETNNLFVPRDWKDRFSYQLIFQTGFKNCYNQLVERCRGNDR